MQDVKGGTLEVNLRNPVSMDDKPASEGVALVLKPRAQVTRSTKKGYQ